VFAHVRSSERKNNPVTTMESHLAELIIESHFGLFLKKVCSHLLSAGPQSMAEIQRICQLDEKIVRESLLVGLQHNIFYASQLSKITR
jgi:hypothetical protein